MQPESPDQLDVVSQSRWYVLAETELGYGIWRVGQPRTEPPLRTFGEDADAFSDADREFRRRNRWMRTHVTLPKFLAGVVFVAILIWIVASAIVNGSYIFAALGDPGGFFQRHLPPCCSDSGVAGEQPLGRCVGRPPNTLPPTTVERGAGSWLTRLVQPERCWGCARSSPSASSW